MPVVSYKALKIAFSVFVIFGAAVYLEVPNVIVELYTLSSLDTFTKIESPPTSARDSHESIKARHANILSKSAELGSCIGSRVAAATGDTIPKGTVGRTMIAAWNHSTLLDLAGPSYAGAFQLIKHYYCVDEIRDVTAGTAEDAVAKAFRACITKLLATAMMFNFLNGLGTVIPVYATASAHIQEQLGWGRFKPLLLLSEFGVVQNYFTISSQYNQSTAVYMYTMVATTFGLHRYDPCSSQLHPADRAPASVPVADIAAAWVREVHNWNAVEEPRYRDPKMAMLPRSIIYGYVMSGVVVDQIPHVFDVANVVILSTPAFKLKSKSHDTTSLLKLLITSKSETNLIAGGFYSITVIMELSIERSGQLFLNRPTISITDPSPPNHKYGPTKQVVHLGSKPDADQLDPWAYTDGWDGRVVSPDTQTALAALHPLHMLSYLDWVGTIGAPALAMDKPTVRILRRATEFAVDLELMDSILGDFAVSGVGLALFKSLDTVGLRHPSCSQSKTSLDTDCVKRQLLECIGYEGGVDPKISRAPREANQNCFDTGAAMVEASREVNAKYATAQGIGTSPDINCASLLLGAAYGACLLNPVQFQRSTANPDAIAVEKLLPDIAKVGVRNCPLACTGSPFAVHECGVPNTRAWCSDLFIRLLPMLASDSFTSPYKRAWERVVSKAAFEEQGEMIKRGTTGDFNTIKRVGWVTRNDPITNLSSIWVAICGALSFAVSCHMAWLYHKDPLDCLNHLLNGVVFTLKRQDAQPDEDLPFCGAVSDLCVRFIISFLTFGLLVAECTLPTGIDMRSIGGANRVCETLFPRVGVLGVAGPFYHITGLVVHTHHSMILFVFVCVVYIITFAILVTQDLYGADLDTIFWIAPALIQATAIGLVAALCYYKVNQKINAPQWAERLLLSAKLNSRTDAYNIAAVPPFCMQAFFALADLHSCPVIKIRQMLVIHSDAIVADAPHSEVFILDPADQEPPEEYTDYVRNNPREVTYPPAFLRTHVPTEDIKDRVEASYYALSLFYLTIRRLPKDARDHGDNNAPIMKDVALEMI